MILAVFYRSFSFSFISIFHNSCSMW